MSGLRMQRRPHSSVGAGARCHLSSRDRLAVIADFDVPWAIRICHGGCLLRSIACTCLGAPAARAETGLTTPVSAENVVNLVRRGDIRWSGRRREPYSDAVPRGGLAGRP